MSDLRLKCAKFACGWDPPQNPLGELTADSGAYSIAVFKKPI